MKFILDDNFIKKHFSRFLKENDIYERCRKYKCNSYRMFDLNISWGSTKQGFFYWKYIQIKYIYELLILFKSSSINEMEYTEKDLKHYFSYLGSAYSGNDAIRHEKDSYFKYKINEIEIKAKTYGLL